MIQCTICAKDETHKFCSKETADYYICRNCSALFQHPAPDADTMVSYVDTEYEGGLYRQYVEAREMKLDHFRSRLERLLPHVKKGRLLDVGCACGYFLEVAAECGYEVQGLEFSKAAIAAASPAMRPKIIPASIDTLSSGERYDLITAFDLIEHLQQPKALLRKAHDLLNIGGNVVIATPDAEHVLRSVMRSRWPMLQPMQHLTIFSRRAMRIALEEAGFTEIRFEPAFKTLTYEYLVGQLKTLTPLLYTGFRLLGRVLPVRTMRKYRRVNIGEFMAIATRPN
jgi:SAM-dependent methyltransferase